MTVELVMVPQACVAGRVLDIGGAPVASFECSVRRVSAPQPNGMRFYEDTNISQTFATQADGAFELCGLNSGSYVVVAKAEGYAPTLSDVFSLVDGQNRVQIDVRLGMGGSIKGRVIGPGGTPLAGATVSTHSDTFEEDAIDSFFENLMPTNVTEKKVRTNANGEFELTLLTPETYQVRVLHRDFTDGKVRGVNVRQGGPTDLGTITMQVGGTVRGTVYDQAGQAAARAFVYLESYQGEKTYSARADANGNYLFSHVRPGQYMLSATGVSTEGPQAINAIIDQRSSQMEITVGDGGEVVKDMRIGG
jgi:protocatechuate 3,4-dioxygenase beta subunit